MDIIFNTCHYHRCFIHGIVLHSNESHPPWKKLHIQRVLAELQVKPQTVHCRVADLSVYVCRADYTRKYEYTLINELIDGIKLPNLCTVINGLDLKKRKYGYYYGYGKYGKYYGYGKRYGYGYGYGEQSHAKED